MKLSYLLNIVAPKHSIIKYRSNFSLSSLWRKRYILNIPLPPISRERSSHKKGTQNPQISQKRMSYILFFLIPKDTINIDFNIMTTIHVNFTMMTLINSKVLDKQEITIMFIFLIILCLLFS